jgi:hypothetical protein
MAYYQIAILALLLCLTPGCVKKAPDQEPPPPPAKPDPGPKVLLEHEALSRELQCDQLKLPMLSLEANILKPSRVAPGSELHHRFVYAFCPASDGGPEKGTLMRKLSLKGKIVFLDQDKDFILTPGRSAVDAFFLVPEGAPPGTYVLELDFKGAGKGPHGAKPLSFSAKEILFINAEQ